MWSTKLSNQRIQCLFPFAPFLRPLAGLTTLGMAFRISTPIAVMWRRWRTLPRFGMHVESQRKFWWPPDGKWRYVFGCFTFNFHNIVLISSQEWPVKILMISSTSFAWRTNATHHRWGIATSPNASPLVSTMWQCTVFPIQGRCWKGTSSLSTSVSLWAPTAMATMVTAAIHLPSASATRQPSISLVAAVERVLGVYPLMHLRPRSPHSL